MITPDGIRQELFIVGKELSKASTAIHNLELAAERAELEAQARMDAVYLTADGSIEDRKALARQKAVQERDKAVIAKAEYNRAKMKAKHLELEQMRLMASLKSIQMEGG